MRWGYGEHSVGCGCCLQRGAGGHGEPWGAGEAGGRLSSAAGGVHNARTQLLARSPGAGERPGGKKKMNKTLKQAQPKGARMGRGAYGGPKSSAPVSGRHGEPPKLSVLHTPSNSKQGAGTSGGGGLTPVCHGHPVAFTFILHSRCRWLSEEAQLEIFPGESSPCAGTRPEHSRAHARPRHGSGCPGGV